MVYTENSVRPWGDHGDSEHGARGPGYGRGPLTALRAWPIFLAC